MSPETDAQENKSTLQNATNWREAASDLIQFWIQEGRCFSSGEVAAALRIHRPDFMFRVQTVGQEIRNMFYDQEMVFYTEGDDNSYPFQALRIAQGLYPYRTPAGTEVFVYGPDMNAINAHEFEIYIPLPNEAVADYPDPDAQAASIPAPSIQQVVGDRLSNTELKTSVSDGRMYIPRTALEGAAYLNGSSIHGGDPVFVSQTDKEIVVLLDDPNSDEFKMYNVWKSGGRVAFPSHDKDNPYKRGDEFICKVEKGKITINITN